MRVGQRLFLAVLPAVFGLLTVAGLAYWGQYAHTAPHWLVIVAIVAAIGSLAIAWINTRYVAQRIQRLADATDARRKGAMHTRIRQAASAVPGAVADAVRPGRGSTTGPNELDTIEETVGRLTSAVSVAEASLSAEVETLKLRRKEYAELLSSVSREAARQVDEIRLPLHILLEARFGEVNENQEEMLSGAQAAAEQAAAELERLREIADLDRGVLSLRRDPVRPSEVIGSLLPALVAEGESRGVRVVSDIAPALPTISGDRARLQQALMIILHDRVAGTPAGGEVRIGLTGDTAAIRLTITHGAARPPSTAWVLAARLIAAHGSTIEGHGGETEVKLKR